MNDDRALTQWSAAQARVMRNALETIARYPVNENSDPDQMAVAITAMQSLALAALTGHKRKDNMNRKF